MHPRSGDVYMTGPSAFTGIPVISDLHCVKREFRFPKDRFIEYEPKDEGWCRFFGIGREVDVPLAYMIGGKLVAHPRIIEQIKATPDLAARRSV